MKSRILVLSTIMTVWVAVGVAQQPAKVAQVEKATVKTQVADAVLHLTASHEKTQVSIAKKTAKAIDPDDAYKSNCTRCHLAPRKFPERKMATIMRHMRVRANLTQEEAKAILGYLTE
ncbi:hypothetical protein MYX82_13265 [Acidobacteria bacterium AH-259-D05]|nr:hypothetical protein [Acidobacteria bacterium AH-259-D05]